MLRVSFLVALILSLFNYIAAECPNACSAHGKCGAYDMCQCYPNWMASDCSERVCQFGLAHVDTPKGDLDASSGKLSGPQATVVTNDFMYPWGTTEQYPAMLDSNGAQLLNSAHYYMECSNKGICDRATGTCACFEGYGGSACQRAECPTTSAGVCSGHGVCETIKRIAELDSENVYQLWDETSTMGCICDGGYSGADCSERICKWGADPLYYDDVANIRVSNWTYQIFTRAGQALYGGGPGTSPTTTAAPATVTGNYSLVIYDTLGEDWQTAPISIDASCKEVAAALYDIPNNVVPYGSVRCMRHAFDTPVTVNSTNYNNKPMHPSHANTAYYPIYDANLVFKTKFTLVFTQNPGNMKQIKINKYLDGNRPTLFTNEATSTLGWHIYPNGFSGEDMDMVPDYCEGVLATLTAGTGFYEITGLDVQETKALKRCLGDSNGDLGDNTEVYNWDYGNLENPHLIKLIESTQDFVPEGEKARDSAQDKVPWTPLCPVITKEGAVGANVDRSYSSYRSNSVPSVTNSYGWCTNKNPPGFYAVLYYELSTSKFKIFTRAGQDYASTTEFHIFTTKGTLQRTTRYGSAFTDTYGSSAGLRARSYHSKTIYTTNTTYAAGWTGQVDCESTLNVANAWGSTAINLNNGGTTPLLDCLEKDDYVMFINIGANSSTSVVSKTPPVMNAATTIWPISSANLQDFNSNPIYPNMYKVAKISREHKTAQCDDPIAGQPARCETSEMYRHQIVLDKSLNTKYYYAGMDQAENTQAAIFKFYPPSATKEKYAKYCTSRSKCVTVTAGVSSGVVYPDPSIHSTYAGECSNRGNCNQATGICECYNGYTGDNCGIQNSLAVQIGQTDRSID